MIILVRKINLNKNTLKLTKIFYGSIPKFYISLSVIRLGNTVEWGSVWTIVEGPESVP